MQEHSGEALALNVHTKQDYRDWRVQMFPEELRTAPGWSGYPMNVFNKNSFWGVVQHLARMHTALNQAVQGKAWNESKKEYTEVPEYRRVQKVPTNVREWRALRKAADSPYAILWPLSMSTAVKTVCDIAVFLLKWWQESENGCAKWQPRCSFKDHRDILVEVFILWTLEHIPQRILRRR